MPHGFDPKPSNVAVAQLVHLHSQLGASLLANKQARSKLEADMRAVEAVIRMFDPDYDTRRIAVKRRNTGNPWFKRGKMFRAALDVMRSAGRPLSTMEMAKLLTAKGPEPTEKQMRKLDSALRSWLNGHEGASVQSDGGRPKRWVLKDGTEPEDS